MDEEVKSSDTESEIDSTCQTPRLSASPTRSIDDEEPERRDTVPIDIPSRPGVQRRLSTYQHTPLDVERGRSARKLRNSRALNSL
jgi:hypothetical protein